MGADAAGFGSDFGVAVLAVQQGSGVVGKCAFWVLLGCALAAPAQVSLVRTGGAEKDLSGTWTGATRIGARSVPLCLVLRYDNGIPVGTIGPDPGHQNGWPVTVGDGAVRFRPDPVSEIRLTLVDGRLAGEIARVVSDARAEVPLPEETVGFDNIVRNAGFGL